MRGTLLAGLMAAIALPAPAFAAPRHAPADTGEARCTKDDLVHAQVSPAVTRAVTDAVTILEKGARLRDVAKLELPCGYHLDDRFGGYLIVANGADVRRYVENNAFGFAPAFGFSDDTQKSYTLHYQPADVDRLHQDECIAVLKSIRSDLRRCASFGNHNSFFATARDGGKTHLSHYKIKDGRAGQDFAVADIDARVESLSFLPPPDAAGGTITLIVTIHGALYRAYLDTPKG